MVLIVSGAPFTEINVLPFSRLETVDIRFSADANWKRLLIVMTVLWGAVFNFGAILSVRDN